MEFYGKFGVLHDSTWQKSLKLSTMWLHSINNIVVNKYVEKLAQDSAYSMFERNVQEYVKFPINKPEKLNLDPVKFCPEYERKSNKRRVHLNSSNFLSLIL